MITRDVHFRDEWPTIPTAPGVCARQACGASPAHWYNASTRAWYCTSCAKRINEHAPGLCRLDEIRHRWGASLAELYPDPAPGKRYACGCVVVSEVTHRPMSFAIDPCEAHRI